MKAGVLTAPEKIEIKEIPMVSLKKETQVIVKVKAIGICGTDLHVYRGERADVEFPRIMGHELAGIVTETGNKVTGLQAGDHVILDPVMSCHSCHTCQRGHENVCEQVKCFGVQMDGGFQEYICVEEGALYKIPSDVSYPRAALGEPFSIAANIIEKAKVQKEDQVVIFGAGTIGIAVLQIMKKIGCKVLIADISDTKLELAEKFGADVIVNTKNEELKDAVEKKFQNIADVLIDAVGSAGTTETAVKIASPCARIIVLGFDSRTMALSPGDITRKELMLLGSRMNNRRFPKVVQWLADGTITEKMITGTYKFEELDFAFKDTLKNGEKSLKTMIVMEE